MEIKDIEVYTTADFRKWLKKNHKTESKVRLILHKRHTGKTAPTHRELIEEAICFGWIDTIIKRLDEDTFARNFSRRNNTSKWSYNTLSYAKRLKKEGRMMPEGLRFYAMGRAKPTHDHGIPSHPDMPLELKKALAKEPEVKKHFNTKPPSQKRALYRWLLRAKQPSTRERRVQDILTSIRKGKKDFFDSTNNV
jgi:uncharacterized protein YdeI (YjbR/CyaY-like superfamily)